MHDNMTVAFEIRYPWVARRHRNSTDKFWRTYRDSFITIWHADPETDGSDDSCDWSGGHLSKREQEFMNQIIDNPDDNIQHFFPGETDYHMKFVVACITRYARRMYKPRPWWRHPRWHVWHWRFQVHPVQKFKRWAFSRCGRCGGRFTWGYAPMSNSWHSEGPRWFRGESDVFHRECSGVEIASS